MSKKLVTVVTTFYNAESTILDTINSIAGQSYNNIEVIFIDGKSTDRSLDIVKENLFRFNKYKILSEQDNGIYDGMNKGIKLSSGEFVAILNADDFFEEDALLNVVKLFSEDTDIVAGTIRKVTADKKEISIVCRHEMKELSTSNPTIHHPGIFVRKSLYERIGFFNSKYMISADFDFVSRAINAAAKIKYSDKVLTNMRVGGVSDSLKFHSKKNWEHLRIGYHNINDSKKYMNFTYYVLKKYVFGLLVFFGVIKTKV